MSILVDSGIEECYKCLRSRTPSVYDAAGRKVLLEQRKADTTALAIYTATYDAAGMQISTLELDGSVNDYSYDASYQLLNETRTGSSAFSTTFTYDSTGNRLTQNADGTLTTSTYDAANELFTTTTNSDITTFTHDANGNRLQENANGSLTTYTWDEENRMIGADDGTNTDSFIYAGNGQRRKKSTSTQDINYLWDEQNILEELDDSNNLIAHYTGFPGYWGGLSSLAQPGSTPAPATAGMGAFNAVQFNQALFNQSSEQVETESHYYLFDLQASNRLLLNTNAATDNEYLYQSFGEKVLSSETIRNPFQFQGQAGPYFDADNRTQMGARIVDPIVGKWFSPDPIGFVGGDWNLYRFVENNPANLIDPSGLSCYCCNFFFAFAWCCDESCFTSPPIVLPKKQYLDPGIDPWYENARRSGGPPTRQWPSYQNAQYEKNLMCMGAAEIVTLINPFTGKRDYRAHARNMTPLLAPKGMDIMANIRIAEEKQTLGFYTKVFKWFPPMVGANSDWDFKAKVKVPYSQSAWNRTFEDFGNFHFGVVGRAAGISRFVLKNGAGWAQFKDHTVNWGTFRGSLRTLDDPRDQEMITRGMNWYEAYALAKTAHEAHHAGNIIGYKEDIGKPWYMD